MAITRCKSFVGNGSKNIEEKINGFIRGAEYEDVTMKVIGIQTEVNFIGVLPTFYAFIVYELDEKK